MVLAGRKAWFLHPESLRLPLTFRRQGQMPTQHEARAADSARGPQPLGRREPGPR